MPAAVGAVAGAFASAAASTYIFSGVGGFIGTVAIKSVLGAAVGAVVSGLVTSAFAGNRAGTPRPAESVGSPILITTGSTTEPIPVVYGYARVGGKVHYKEVGGGRDIALFLAITLSEGPIAGIDMMYIDGVPYTDPKFQGLVILEKYLGDQTEISPIIRAHFPDAFDDTDIANGIAYAVVVLTRTQNQSLHLFNGIPQLTFDIRGRLLYDTRDGGTRFSNNPALCIRDYWTNTLYGRGIPTAAMLDTSFTSEANHYDARESVPTYSATCSGEPETDEIRFEEDQPIDNLDGIRLTTTGSLPGGLSASPTTYYARRVSPRRFKLATSVANALAETFVDITSAGSGTHTANHYDQPRYTCNGVVNVDNDVIDNLVRLRSSCQAWLFQTAGKYQLVTDRASAAVSPTLTRDNMLGGWRITGVGKTGRYNRVRARFPDPDLGYQYNFAILDNATDRTTDGETLLQGDIELDFTTNIFMARRIASLEQRKSRLTLRASFTAAMPAFRIEPGNVVAITHATPGWSAQTFRVMSIGLLEAEQLEFEVREYADIWTGLSPGDAYTPPARTTLPRPEDYIPPRVAGLELFGQGLDTEFTGRDAKFAWRNNSEFDAWTLLTQPAGATVREPWHNGWIVTLYNADGTTERRTEHIYQPAYTYSLEKNKEDADSLGESGPAREFMIRVWGITRYGRRSLQAARLSVENPASTITDFTVTPTWDGGVARYSRPTDTDFAGVKVHVSATNGFTPSAGNLVYDGFDTEIILRNLNGATTYYYKIIPYDGFGAGDTSAQSSFTTLKPNNRAVYGPVPTGVNHNVLGDASYGQVVLALAEHTAYPSPSGFLRATFSGQMVTGGTVDNPIFDFSVRAYSAKPAAAGTVAIAYDSIDAGAVVFAVTGTGTNFALLAVGDLIYVGVGRPLFKVFSIASATSMKVKEFDDASATASMFPLSGLAWTAWRPGTALGNDPSGFNRSPVANASTDVSLRTGVALTESGMSGVIVWMMSTGLSSSGAVAMQERSLDSQWVVGAG